MKHKITCPVCLFNSYDNILKKCSFCSVIEYEKKHSKNKATDNCVNLSKKIWEIIENIITQGGKKEKSNLIKLLKDKKNNNENEYYRIIKYLINMALADNINQHSIIFIITELGPSIQEINKEYILNISEKPDCFLKEYLTKMMGKNFNISIIDKFPNQNIKKISFLILRYLLTGKSLEKKSYFKQLFFRIKENILEETTAFPLIYENDKDIIEFIDAHLTLISLRELPPYKEFPVLEEILIQKKKPPIKTTEEKKKEIKLAEKLRETVEIIEEEPMLEAVPVDEKEAEPILGTVSIQEEPAPMFADIAIDDLDEDELELELELEEEAEIPELEIIDINIISTEKISKDDKIDESLAIDSDTGLMTEPVILDKADLEKLEDFHMEDLEPSGREDLEMPDEITLAPMEEMESEVIGAMEDEVISDEKSKIAKEGFFGAGLIEDEEILADQDVLKEEERRDLKVKEEILDQAEIIHRKKEKMVIEPSQDKFIQEDAKKQKKIPSKQPVSIKVPKPKPQAPCQTLPGRVSERRKSRIEPSAYQPSIYKRKVKKAIIIFTVPFKTITWLSKKIYAFVVKSYKFIKGKVQNKAQQEGIFVFELFLSDDAAQPGIIERIAAQSTIVLKSLQYTIGLKFIIMANIFDSIIEIFSSYINSVFRSWKMLKAVRKRINRQLNDNHIKSVIEELATTRIKLSRLFCFPGFYLEEYSCNKEEVSKEWKKSIDPSFALELILDIRGNLDEMKQDLNLITPKQISLFLKGSIKDFLISLIPNPTEIILPFKDLFILTFIMKYPRDEIENIYASIFSCYLKIADLLETNYNYKKPDISDYQNGLGEHNLNFMEYENFIFKNLTKKKFLGNEENIDETIDTNKKNLQRMLQLLFNISYAINLKKWKRKDIIKTINDMTSLNRLHPQYNIEFERWLMQKIENRLSKENLLTLEEKGLRLQEAKDFRYRYQLCQKLAQKFITI